MSSPAEKKGKGKVPTRDYLQDKRLPAMGQSFEKHEGASSTSHRGAASLQPMYPEMVTYSSGFMAINEKYKLGCGLITSTAGGRVTSKYPIHDSGVTSLN